MVNRNKEEIIEEINKIKEYGTKLGLEIDLNPEKIYEFKQDAIWYGGNIGVIKKDDFIIEISVLGDVRTEFTDKENDIFIEIKDKNNSGDFHKEMSNYIKNDEELFILEGFTDIDINSLNKSFLIDNNNWIEYNIYNSKTKTYIELALLENIFETNDVLSAFTELLDDFESINSILNLKGEN